MSYTSVPVTLIEATEGAKVVKVIDYNPWRAPVTFTLSDGRKIETSKRFRLKRDAVAYLATLPIPTTNTSVEFDETGKFVGYQESFQIGAQGLKELAVAER